MPTHYEVLGIAQSASEEEVRQAYRRLVKASHPDLAGDPARFRLLTQAYDVLSDPARRAAYDRRLGRPGPEPLAGPPASGRRRSGWLAVLALAALIVAGEGEDGEPPGAPAPGGGRSGEGLGSGTDEPAVVGRPPGRIRQHVVGLGDDPEARRVAGQVGVGRLDQPPVRLPDLLIGGALRDAEDLVVGRHSRTLPRACAGQVAMIVAASAIR